MIESNGETKLLNKLVLWITILGAIIGPWVYHDREITVLNANINNLTLRIDNLSKVIDEHIKHTAGLDTDRLKVIP
jgi:hypothetical protein